MSELESWDGAGNKNWRVIDLWMGFQAEGQMRSLRGMNIGREEKRTGHNPGPPTLRGQGEEEGSGKETEREQPERQEEKQKRPGEENVSGESDQMCQVLLLDEDRELTILCDSWE